MTVHARGYRPYGGPLLGLPPAFALAREGIRTAWTRKALKRIGVLYLLWFGMLAFFLYLSMSGDVFDVLDDLARRFPGLANPSLLLLNTVLQLFYTVLAYLSALLAIFVGAPLVADDLEAGALPLYLVRPLRAADYVLGKALVVPVVLAAMLLVPGVLFYVLVGVWQPPGESLPFLAGNLDVLGRVAWHVAVSAAAYTGLVLLLSARTSRRAVAAAIAGALLFAGVMLHVAGENAAVGGLVADVLRHANLPWDTVTGLLPDSATWRFRPRPPPLPSPSVVASIAAVLLVLGLWTTWRRARSVEVTG